MLDKFWTYIDKFCWVFFFRHVSMFMFFFGGKPSDSITDAVTTSHPVPTRSGFPGSLGVDGPGLVCSRVGFSQGKSRGENEKKHLQNDDTRAPPLQKKIKTSFSEDFVGVIFFENYGYSAIKEKDPIFNKGRGWEVRERAYQQKSPPPSGSTLVYPSGSALVVDTQAPPALIEQRTLTCKDDMHKELLY